MKLRNIEYIFVYVMYGMQDNSGALLQDEEYIITEDLKSGNIFEVTIAMPELIIPYPLSLQYNTKKVASSQTSQKQL